MNIKLLSFKVYNNNNNNKVYNNETIYAMHTATKTVIFTNTGDKY